MIEELLYEEESATLDFKSEQYSFNKGTEIQKSELLKDILAFANAWRRSDAYILIGVKEVKGRKSEVIGIEEDIDDAQIQQFVNSKTHRPIDFSYKSIIFEDKKIGIIHIPVNMRPVFLKIDYGKLRKNIVYIRRGSSTDEANPDEISRMGDPSHSVQELIPSLKLEFADIKERVSLGHQLNFKSTLLNIPPKAQIPDFKDKTNPWSNYAMSINHANSDYYRELSAYYYWLMRSRKIGFSITNSSIISATGVKIDIEIEQHNNSFIFLESSRFPELPKAYYSPLDNIRPLSQQLKEVQMPSPDIAIRRLPEKWLIEVSFEKAQPKQIVYTRNYIYFAPSKPMELELKYTIYADNLPLPKSGCYANLEMSYSYQFRNVRFLYFT